MFELFSNCPKCNVCAPLDPVFDGRGMCLQCGTQWRERRARRKSNKPPRTVRSFREQALMRKYGLTIEKYDQMVANQNGRCAICNGPPEGRRNRLVVDHCHATGRVRGLLCTACNAGLGMMRESRAAMIRAIEYLQE